MYLLLYQHLLSSFEKKIQNCIIYSNKNSTLSKIFYILDKLHSGAFMISDRTNYVDKFYRPSSSSLVNCVHVQPVQGLLCLYQKSLAWFTARVSFSESRVSIDDSDVLVTYCPFCFHHCSYTEKSIMTDQDIWP